MVGRLLLLFLVVVLASPASGCAEYLAGLRLVDREANGDHPDLISLEEWATLAPGTEVFLGTSALTFLQRRQLPSVPVAMRFVSRRTLSRGRYRRWDEVVSLHNDELGTVVLPLFAVALDGYRRGDFASRARYAPGEAVQLGYGFSETVLLLPLPGDAGGGLRFHRAFLPYLARYVRAYSETELLVRVIHDAGDGSPVIDRTLRARREDVRPLPGGTPEVFERRLAAAAVPEFSLVAGSRVRFRDEHGAMRGGVLWRKRGNAWEVRNDAGAFFVLPRRIFRALDGRPAFTPRYSNPQITALLTPNVRWLAVLDAAARFTSSDAFLAMKDPQRFEALVEFVQSFLRYSRAASLAHRSGFAAADSLLGAGIGVCRYGALLLQTILCESGYAARAASRYSSAAQSGHTWVDVENHVLCPSGGGVVTLAEAFRRARLRLGESWEEYLGHPDREGPFWALDNAP